VRYFALAVDILKRGFVKNQINAEIAGLRNCHVVRRAIENKRERRIAIRIAGAKAQKRVRCDVISLKNNNFPYSFCTENGIYFDS
jgi:hypothetical protein